MSGDSLFGGFFSITVLLFLGFVGFVIYFIFKQMQFVLVAVDLYKQMVNRQDTMVSLLMQLRDSSIGRSGQTDTTELKEMTESQSAGWKCQCGQINPAGFPNCTNCKRAPNAIY